MTLGEVRSLENGREEKALGTRMKGGVRVPSALARKVSRL